MFSSKKSARHAPNPPNDASERQENEQPTASSETPRSMPKEQVYETGLKSARHEPSPNNFAVKPTIGPKRSLVQSTADDLVDAVGLSDYKGCDNFLSKNTVLLEADDRDVEQAFLSGSADALGRDKNTLAASYVEKYAIIKCIRGYRELKKPDFLRSLIQKDRAVVDKLRQTINKIKDNRDKTIATRATVPTTEQASKIDLPIRETAKKASAPVSDRHVVPPGVQSPRTSSKQLELPAVRDPDPDIEDNDMYGGTAAPGRGHGGYTGKGKGKDRATEGSTALAKSYPYASGEGVGRGYDGYTGKGKGKDRATEGSTALVKSYPYASGEKVERDHGPHAGRVSEQKVSGTSQARLLTMGRFKSLPQKDWSYFRVGKVFAIEAFDEDTSQSTAPEDVSIESLISTRGTRILEKIRRVILVKQRHGFCMAVPIYTYGNKGLKKLGLSNRSIEAHARIHIAGQKQDWLPDEPRTPKRDIEVTPEPGEKVSLLRASRVCFEKQIPIEYNKRIMKIGTVTQQSLTFLTQYVQEEYARPDEGEQGDSRRRVSLTQGHDYGSRSNEPHEYRRQPARTDDSRPGERSGQGAGARQQPSSGEHYRRRGSDDHHRSGQRSHNQKGYRR